MTTLYQLRKESKLSWRQVVDKALEKDPNFPKTAAGLACIEKRGTENYYQLSAFAHVYGKTFAEILMIAMPSSRTSERKTFSQNAENALTSV